MRYFEQYLKRFQSSNYTEEICIYVINNGEIPNIGFGLNTSEQSPEQSIEDILLHFAE